MMELGSTERRTNHFWMKETKNILQDSCSEGLLPRNGPVFFTGKGSWLQKHCKKIKKAKCTLDNRIYADFISKYFVRRLRNDLVDDLADYIWQDDGDKKHRTKHVRERLSEVFEQRLDPDHQADKMADVWPIENVWGMLTESLRGRVFKSNASLKRAINKAWKDIDAATCSKMMDSIPKRLLAVIKRNGEQIHRNDYK